MHIKPSPFDSTYYDEKINALLEKLDKKRMRPSKTIFVSDEVIKNKIAKASGASSATLLAISVSLFGLGVYYSTSSPGGLGALAGVASLGMGCLYAKYSTTGKVRPFVATFMHLGGVSLPLDKEEATSIKRWADLYPAFGETVGRWLASNPDRQLNSNDYFKSKRVMEKVEKIDAAKRVAQKDYDQGVAQQSEHNELFQGTTIISSARRTLLMKVAESSSDNRNLGTIRKDSDRKPAM